VAETLCRAWKLERLTDWHEPVSLRVFVEKNIATVMLDISGTPLFRRGYRKEGGAAPLRETSAAALLLLSNWRRKTPLYDPFCGSGTFAIEAALYAWNVPVGISRTFALEDLAIADAALFKKVKAQAIEGIDTNCRVRIAGSDQDPKAIANANANFSRALKQLSLPSAPAHQPTFDVSPLEDARPPFDEEGLIITNPPWANA
jgi:putative N6-adenine-specific DNA methylase